LPGFRRGLQEYYSEEGSDAKPVTLIYAKLLPPVAKNHLRVFQGEPG
jgi:hypothetical protein